MRKGRWERPTHMYEICSTMLISDLLYHHMARPCAFYLPFRSGHLWHIVTYSLTSNSSLIPLLLSPRTPTLLRIQLHTGTCSYTDPQHGSNSKGSQTVVDSYWRSTHLFTVGNTFEFSRNDPTLYLVYSLQLPKVFLGVHHPRSVSMFPATSSSSSLRSFLSLAMKIDWFICKFWRRWCDKYTRTVRWIGWNFTRKWYIQRYDSEHHNDVFMGIDKHIYLIDRLIWLLVLLHMFNTLRPRQNGRHFADDIFKCIFLIENAWIPIKNSL